MKIDRRITNGLAWAGVVLVVGVPLADMVSAQVMGEGSDARPAQIAMIEPVAQPAPVAKVAPVPRAASARPAAPVAKPVVQPAAVAVTPAAPSSVAVARPVQTAAANVDATTTGSVVDSYLQSGKALPSYITGASQTPPAKPAAAEVLSPIIAVPAVPVAPVTAPAPAAVETASLTPDRIAPMPMPLSMRPAPALIVPEQTGMQSTQSFQVGPSSDRRSSATVTSRDLQDWESGPLSEFLAKRQAGGGRVDPNYDADGFYLDQGPNAAPPRDRLIGPADDDGFFPFVN